MRRSELTEPSALRLSERELAFLEANRARLERERPMTYGTLAACMAAALIGSAACAYASYDPPMVWERVGQPVVATKRPEVCIDLRKPHTADKGQACEGKYLAKPTQRMV